MVASSERDLCLGILLLLKELRLVGHVGRGSPFLEDTVVVFFTTVSFDVE